jgi:hypothetical protein
MIKVRTGSQGFSSAEALAAMALGALVIGAVAIAYGSVIRNRPRTADNTPLTIAADRAAYFGLGTTTPRVPVAPSYDALAQAEAMRERFWADVMGATAVFPLARADASYAQAPVRPYEINYDPVVDTYTNTDTATRLNFPDSPLNFRDLLLRRASAVASVFPSGLGNRFYNETATNASIYVIGYSDAPGKLRVNAIYEIDINKLTSPQGFFASVRRYSRATAVSPIPTVPTMRYEVFFPGYNGTGKDGQTVSWPTTTDNFTPLWAAFETTARDHPRTAEPSVSIQPFKRAVEQPFALIWWPDPGAKTLGRYRATNSPISSSLPISKYNHMGGRTSFMFAVPILGAAY